MEFHLFTLEHLSPLPNIYSPTLLKRAPGSLAVDSSVFSVFLTGLGGKFMPALGTFETGCC